MTELSASSAAFDGECCPPAGSTRPGGQHSGDRWWRDAVVYQIYPRSFQDSNGDGVGDLPGITSRLDYLAGLGVGALWICPFYPSPGYDGGYDVADYCGVDPRFGTLADLDELIAQAHARGIKVVLDVVVNHTSHEHPWYREALDPASAKRDWYLWSDPRPGHVGGERGAEPTNWGAAFGGSTWTWHPESGQYSFSLFSAYQPDLNWANPQLRAAVADMLRWWLDRGVDGFRFDVINLIDKPALVDAELTGDSVGGGEFADGISLATNGPRLTEYLRELRREVLGDRQDILLLGETPGVSVAEAAALTDPETGPLDLVFAFEHSELDREPARWRSQPLDLRRLKDWATRWQTGEGSEVWNSLFLSSHDQARIVSRYGDDGGPAHCGTADGGPGPCWARSATAWAAVLHAHRGTPFVYQGDEIAMTNYPFASIEEFADIEARGVYRDAVAAGADPADVLAGLRRLSRDNGRTPMQWDSSPGAGFTTGEPWLAINPNHVWLNVRAQGEGDVGSLAGSPAAPGSLVPGSCSDSAEKELFPSTPLAFYRALVRLRGIEPALASGDVTVLLPEDPHVYAIERRLPGVPDDGAEPRETRLLVVANLSGEARAWPDGLDSAWADAELLLSNLATAAHGVPWVPTTPSVTHSGSIAGQIAWSADGGSTAAPADRLVLQPWEARVLRRASHNQDHDHDHDSDRDRGSDHDRDRDQDSD